MAYSAAFQSPLPSSSGSSKNNYASFPVDHGRLNPHFEAYRLIQEDEDGDSGSVSHHSLPLPSQPLPLADIYDFGLNHGTQRSTLGFKETKQRASHRFLVPANGTSSSPTDGPVAAYIDQNGFVVLLAFAASPSTAASPRLVGHPVHHLDLHSSQEPDRMLPSLVSVSPTLWLASDGSGKLHVLQIEPVPSPHGGPSRWISAHVRTAALRPNESTAPVPFAVFQADKDSDGKIQVLLQSVRRLTEASSKQQSSSFRGLGYQAASNTSTLTSAAAAKVVFDVHLACFDPTPAEDGDRALLVKWTVTGDEPLDFAKMDLDSGHHVLCAESAFSATTLATSGGHVQDEEKAEEPRNAPEASSVPSGPVEARHAPEFKPRRPPHYSWAQTSDTLTIAFSLPPSLVKSDIRVHFSLKGISLSLKDPLVNEDRPRIVEIGDEPTEGSLQQPSRASEDDPLENAAQMIRSGRYVSRATWGEIDPSGSVWTWERVMGTGGALKDRPMGVLTLHLEKKHEGTRWTHVFAPSSSPSSGDLKRSGSTVPLSKWEQVSKKTKLSFREARERAERVARGETEEVGDVQMEGIDEDEKEEQQEREETKDDSNSFDEEDDVPETLDPSELVNMLEGMEKYTVDEETMEAATGTHAYGTDRSGLGPALAGGRASLLQDALEEEDENVGRRTVVTWVHESRADGQGGKSTIITSRPNKDTFEERSILALPLAVSGVQQDTVVIKHDLDGAVFSLPTSTSEGNQQWTHVDHLPALAFVLASKRDASRVFAYRPKRPAPTGYGTAILAFESAPQVSGTATSGAGAGNLFVYYSNPLSHPQPETSKHGRSRVIRLGSDEPDSSSGALLGVAAVDWQPGNTLLLCLCEKRLLLYSGLL